MAEITVYDLRSTICDTFKDTDVSRPLAYSQFLTGAARYSPGLRLSQPSWPTDFRCRFAAESNPCAVHNLARLAATRALCDSFQCRRWRFKRRARSGSGSPQIEGWPCHSVKRGSTPASRQARYRLRPSMLLSRRRAARAGIGKRQALVAQTLAAHKFFRFRCDRIYRFQSERPSNFLDRDLTATTGGGASPHSL